ncbi:hypothetical protein QR680_009120 [Steinernema hermaphroditum]|uniref:Phosphatidylinositol-3,4,5-trisphosphate 3-phosphatase n=1 Tax=Steinernema hermaphroditum TaxID=289476 RepID=A0AA39M8V3_9BILA|nr:hypothetical protein QR680_009120 [Steinernema hermaphroditum]
MLCFRPPGGENDEITCYGTPRSERRRKSSERQKPNGDVVHATVRMESPRRPLASPGGTSAVECSQITPRLIALTFPSSDSDAAYRTSIREISDHLKKLYHDNYKVFNVSQKRSDLGRSNPVVELGWPERLAPPLDRLCSICKHIETFLQAAPEHVLVLHCKGGRSRAAIVVAAYMHYTSICSSEDSVADRFSMQMFAEKFLRADGQPSHRRYVTYFSNLLSGTTRVNQTPIFLSQCSFQRLGGRAVTLKIYERMKPVFSSGLVVLEESTRFALEAPLSLRGDVLVKCFRKGPGGDRAPFFQCQFNTCALEMSNNNALSLAFFKDELDLLCEDTSVENRATVEFVFLLEPPKGELEKQRKSLSEFSRADSYENFDKPEDDRSASEAASSAPIYSEIQRNSVAPSSVSSSLPTAADGTDSGISSDSPKFQKEGAMPPIPPPKPRRTSVSEDAEEGSVTRQHSVLPAGLRPVAHRPPTPTEGGRVTPRIEPDLVAKDRYDPSSKCFSYVPAKSLNEHFTSPKKPPARRLSEERSVIEPPPEALKESFRNLTFSTSDLSRRPETPKWEEQIEKAAADRYRVEPPRSASIDPEYRGLHSLAELELLSRTNGVVHEDVEEKPVIMNQAKKATKTKRKTKYGSYRTLNDDAYNSDMDELCDPDFYLSYTPTASAPTASAPTPSSGASVSQNGSKSVELPRKSFREVPPRDLDELSDFAEPTTPHRRSCITPKPFSAPYDDEHRNSEAFRYRNCRSVTSTPLLQGRKLFAHDRYDSLADAEHADDWLSAQLRKVRQKRNNDPEVLKRKKQEKILLEELKNAHSDRELVRGRAESDYSIEGVGQRSVDPLLDYQHEEQRLKETRSPFPERPSDLGRGVFDGPRRVMPPSARDAQRPVVRSKPPTPPPRERSRSPPRSPFGGRRLQTPTSTESAYRQERSVLQRTEDALTDDEDDGEFSHLKSLVQDNRSRLEQRFETPTTKSILKRRDTAPSPAVSSADLYASPSTLRHSQTPVEESKRSETPAFPVSRRGETPLPFHPLLYHGASSQPNGSAAHHSFTHRSASPRSFYYGGAHSRRSSMTSIAATHFPARCPLRRTSGGPLGIRVRRLCQSVVTRPPPSVALRASRAIPRVFSRGASRQYSLAPFAPLATPMPCDLAMRSESSPSTSHNGVADGDDLSARAPSERSSENQQSAVRANGKLQMTELPKDAGDVIHHHPVFVKDTSKYWYKPTISREEAINMLRDKPPGTFVVRDSNSFPGAFGLALKVATPPPGVAVADGTELVRHFLIEPSPKGVKLKGCNNEPVFGTLSALVYQHSITPLALPTKLTLPEFDPAATPEHLSATQALLEQGAACNVVYIFSCDTESLTGPEAVRRCTEEAFRLQIEGSVRPVSAHFKVSSQGITITDNTRKLFFRRHYPVHAVTHAGLDPDDRRWDNTRMTPLLAASAVKKARLFGFVARKVGSRTDNACHLFAELDPDQPAQAVCNFITKVMMSS